MKLALELVPKTCWYSNVRSNVSPETWDRLQTTCFQKALYRCEICGGRGRNHPVECHEIWQYDDHRKIQRLERLIALCPKCHEVKHIGLALRNGKAQQVLTWLCQINEIAPEQALSLVKHAFAVHQIRSAFSWTLDIEVLRTGYQVKLGSDYREQGINYPR